ncbi:hypothetical protein R6Q59_031053 [Mikania micrantha]
MEEIIESYVVATEMAEEMQNQSEISLKRIRFDEITDDETGDEDRISRLPNCLLVEILSRLPATKDAIKTGTLSKRWKNLWTSVSNLIFVHHDEDNLQLSLTFWNMECEAEFLLDQFFFINSCFTDLTLSGYKNLIDNILSGSPVLETLVLDNCYGYRRLDITSKSVKNLVFSGYMIPDDVSDDLADVIEINAPNILSLTIQDDLLLWKLLLVNVYYLVEADLDYTKGGHYDTNPKQAEEDMLKEFILNLRHVKELKIGIFCFKVLSRLEAKGFIFSSNLKVLDVTSSPCYSDNDSLELSDWSNSDSAVRRDWEVLLIDDG